MRLFWKHLGLRKGIQMSSPYTSDGELVAAGSE